MKKPLIIVLILALSIGILVWSLLNAPKGSGDDDTTLPAGASTSATTAGAGSSTGSGSTTGSSTSASTTGTTAATTTPPIGGGLGDGTELPDDSL